VLYDPASDPRLLLDTNRDGWLDRRDGTVRVRDGSMTIDFSAVFARVDAAGVVVTLVGRTRIGVDQIYETQDQ